MNPSDNLNIMLQKKWKWLVVALLIALVLFVVWGVLQSIRTNGKVELVTKKVPGNAVIRVDGQIYKGGIHLSPGSYEITASKEGFESFTYRVNVYENGSSVYANTLYFLLQPKSAEAIEWASDNQDKYLKLEEEVGELRAIEGDEQQKQYPILQKIPYRGSLYNVDYVLDDTGLTLQITTDDALGRQVALAMIKNWGYEPIDYRVEFLNYNNPFAPVGSGAEGEVEER
jgi:hypothetical protein